MWLSNKSGKHSFLNAVIATVGGGKSDNPVHSHRVFKSFPLPKINVKWELKSNQVLGINDSPFPLLSESTEDLLYFCQLLQSAKFKELTKLFLLHVDFLYKKKKRYSSYHEISIYSFDSPWDGIFGNKKTFFLQ